MSNKYDELLLQLRKSKRPLEFIASQAGRTTSEVYKRLRELRELNKDRSQRFVLKVLFNRKRSASLNRHLEGVITEENPDVEVNISDQDVLILSSTAVSKIQKLVVELLPDLCYRPDSDSAGLGRLNKGDYCLRIALGDRRRLRERIRSQEWEAKVSFTLENVLEIRGEIHSVGSVFVELLDHHLYNPEPDQFDEFLAQVNSEDENSQLDATAQFNRSFLLSGPDFRFSVAVRSGFIQRFVEFSSRDENSKLQFEATRALADIASGSFEDTMAIFDSDVVPLFVRLLSSPSKKVRKEALNGLANVAANSPECRDQVSLQAMRPLLSLVAEDRNQSILRRATWALSNFCSWKPQPEFYQIAPALPVLKGLLQSSDNEVLKYACLAFSDLCVVLGTNETLEGVIPRLVQLLGHHLPPVQLPALRTIGNMVAGDDIQTQAVLDNEALPALLHLLKNTCNKRVKTETCWTISNITAGNASQIQQVIDAGIIQPLVNLLQTGEADIKKEAGLSILNATCGGSDAQIKTEILVRYGCVKPLCDLLTFCDPRVVTVTLEGLEQILNVGEAEKNLGGNGNLFAKMIEEAQGLEKIENLQSHDSAEIYEKAVRILESYWAELIQR